MYLIILLVSKKEKTEDRHTYELVRNYNQALRNAITICYNEGAKDILNVSVPKESTDGNVYTQSLRSLLQEILDAKAKENESHTNN